MDTIDQMETMDPEKLQMILDRTKNAKVVFVGGPQVEMDTKFKKRFSRYSKDFRNMLKGRKS